MKNTPYTLLLLLFLLLLPGLAQLQAQPLQAASSARVKASGFEPLGGREFRGELHEILDIFGTSYSGLDFLPGDLLTDSRCNTYVVVEPDNATRSRVTVTVSMAGTDPPIKPSGGAIIHPPLPFDLRPTLPAEVGQATEYLTQCLENHNTAVLASLSLGVGATILSGFGLPSDTLGRNGDFYVDLGGRDFWGPKAGGSWTNFFSLGAAENSDYDDSFLRESVRIINERLDLDKDTSIINEIQDLYMQDDSTLRITGTNTEIPINRNATPGTGSAFFVTQAHLESLVAPAYVYVNNAVEFTSGPTLDAIVIEIGPNGRLNLNGHQPTFNGPVYSSNPQHRIFYGVARVPRLTQLKVYANWFGARSDAKLDSTGVFVTNNNYTHNFHFFRQAALALNHYGKRKEKVEVLFAESTPGTAYCMTDTTAAERTAIAEEVDPTWLFKEVRSAIKATFRISSTDQASKGVVLLDNVTVRGAGMYNTVLTLPNEGTRGFLEEGAIEQGPYGYAGWLDELENMVTFAVETRDGAMYVEARSAAEAAFFKAGDKIVMTNGASYYDQYYGQQNKVAYVDGARIYLEYAIERSFLPEAMSWNETILADFTQPVEGGVVQIQADGEPGWHQGAFSIGADLYELVTNDGGGLYTIRNVAGKQNAPAGTVIPQGSRAGYPRVIMKAPEVVENFWVEDMTVIGRRDGLRGGNNIGGGMRRVHLRHNQQDPNYSTGLTISMDGGLNYHIDQSRISTTPGQLEAAQIARSTTGMKITNSLIEHVYTMVIEFANNFSLEDSKVVIDAHRNTNPYVDNQAALDLGTTTANHKIRRNVFHLTGVRFAVAPTDIQRWNSVPGLGPIVKDNIWYLNDVEKAFSTFQPGGKWVDDRVYANGVRTLWGGTGAAPMASDTVSVVGTARGSNNAYVAMAPTEITGFQAVGTFDQFIDQPVLNAVITGFNITRQDGSVPGTLNSYAKARGMLIAEGAAGQKVYTAQVEGNAYGFPVDMGDELIQSEAVLGLNDYYKVHLRRARVYKNGTWDGTTVRDEYICIGALCAGPTNTDNQTIYQTPDGKLGITGGNELQLTLSGGEQVSFVDYIVRRRIDKGAVLNGNGLQAIKDYWGWVAPDMQVQKSPNKSVYEVGTVNPLTFTSFTNNPAGETLSNGRWLIGGGEVKTFASAVRDTLTFTFQPGASGGGYNGLSYTVQARHDYAGPEPGTTTDTESVQAVYPVLFGVSMEDFTQTGDIYAAFAEDRLIETEGNKIVPLKGNGYIYLAVPATWNDTQVSIIKDANGYNVTDDFTPYTRTVTSSGLTHNWAQPYVVYRIDNTIGVDGSYNFIF